MQPRRHLIADGLWVVGGRAVDAAAGLTLTVLLARLLTPPDLGRYFTLLSLIGAAFTLAQLGLGTLALRHIASALATGAPAQARRVVRDTVRSGGLGTAAAGAALFAAGSFLGLSLELRWLTTAWMGLLAWQSLLSEILRGFHDIRAAAILQIVADLLGVALLAGAWLLTRQLALDQAVTLIVVGLAAAALLGLGAVRRKWRPLPVAPTKPTHLLAQAWPILLNSLFWLALAQADIWILSAFRPPSDVAVYGAAVRFATLVTLPLEIAKTTILPRISELYARGELAQLESLLRSTAAAASLPALSVLLLYLLAAGPLLALLYGAFYQAGALALIVLGVGQMMNVGTGLCGTTLIVTGRQRLLLATSLVCASFTILAALLLVQPLGLLGVALATTCGVILQTTAMLLLVKRQLGIWTHLGLGRPFLKAAPR